MQWRRGLHTSRDLPRLGDHGQGLCDSLRSNLDRDAFPGGRVVDLAPFGLVAVLAQEEYLGADLDRVRLPGGIVPGVGDLFSCLPG